MEPGPLEMGSDGDSGRHGEGAYLIGVAFGVGEFDNALARVRELRHCGIRGSINDEIHVAAVGWASIAVDTLGIEGEGRG